MDEGKIIRTRIAPSPTGFAHVGTAYTAIFNYAFARKNRGKFVLRLEDTDVERNVKEAEEAIYKGLSWLGIMWDEGPDKGGENGPYRQSERLEIYKTKAKELLKKGFAYEDEGAIRFKNPGEEVSWNDLVRGEIKFKAEEITDFVILRSTGWPLYNFVVTIDDILMNITHVIRAEEHISNTPRQIALYKAFGVTPPRFAHLPALRNAQRQKLSKRRDPVDLRTFRKEGYLPEALVNFLCLLGWSHPQEKEIFDLEEFVELFDISRVRKAGPIFDTAKLDWINGEYIRNLTDEEFLERIKEFTPSDWDIVTFKQIIPLIKTRIKKLSEVKNYAEPFFTRPPIKPELFKDDYINQLSKALKALSQIDEWKKENIDKALLEAVEKNNFKKGDFFMNLRISQFSNIVTPPINDSLFYIGKKEALERIQRYLK